MEEVDGDGYVGRIGWVWGKEPICGLHVGLAVGELSGPAV